MLPQEYDLQCVKDHKYCGSRQVLLARRGDRPKQHLAITTTNR